jgi:hypothetical protein
MPGRNEPEIESIAHNGRPLSPRTDHRTKAVKPNEEAHSAISEAVTDKAPHPDLSTDEIE